jgi:hypothetical protein
MPSEKGSLILASVLIAVGSGWLLSNLDIFPRIDWVWTLGLAMVGGLTFVLSGYDKFSMVVGPFFLLSSIFSAGRQMGWLKAEIEAPSLIIATGVLLLLARSPAIPVPRWIGPSSSPRP